MIPQKRMISSEMPNDDTPFTFRAAQVFVAIVEAQSVTRAAHRLGVSPSTVSQQLATLEAALGTRLLERTARQFRLTRAGRLFLEPARRLLDDVVAIKAQLVLAEEAPPLTLRIASIEELDATVTAPWFLRLTGQFDNLSLSLTSGASHENLDALRSRAVDMMLAVDTVAEVEWVDICPILRDPFIMVTAPGTDVTGGLDRLSRLPCLRYASDLQIGRQVDAQLRRVGVQPSRGFEFTSNQALFAMTAEMGGWAITTALAYLGTPLAGDQLTAHPVPLPRFSRRLALHARAGTLGALPARFAEELRGCIQSRLLSRVAGELPFLSGDLCILR